MTRPWMPLLILLASFSGCDWHRATGVVWEDIHSWRSLGHRWASAYSAEGKRIAIYDLSYPDVRKQIELGLIGSQKIRVQDLVAEIDQGIRDSEPGEKISKLKEQLKTLASDDDFLDRWPDAWWERVPWTAEFI